MKIPTKNCITIITMFKVFTTKKIMFHFRQQFRETNANTEAKCI